jgi:predicted DNA-binding ribbon-helix-helix protein
VSGEHSSPERLFARLPAEDLRPQFRAVARGKIRYGIKLERAFWNCLKRLALSRNVSIGMVVDELAGDQGSSGNLTSAIRVACLSWLTEQNTQLMTLASQKSTNAIITACPSPAFALSSARRIVTFNQPFQLLLRRQLPSASGDDARQELRLALDLNVVEIFDRLKADSDLPVVTGFVLGMGQRRYRGQLNAVRAPVKDAELLIAYIVG